MISSIERHRAASDNIKDAQVPNPNCFRFLFAVKQDGDSVRVRVALPRLYNSNTSVQRNITS